MLSTQAVRRRDDVDQPAKQLAELALGGDAAWRSLLDLKGRVDLRPVLRRQVGLGHGQYHVFFTVHVRPVKIGVIVHDFEQSFKMGRIGGIHAKFLPPAWSRQRRVRAHPAKYPGQWPMRDNAGAAPEKDIGLLWGGAAYRETAPHKKQWLAAKQNLVFAPDFEFPESETAIL